MAKDSAKDAACLIVGDEILSGRTADSNSNYIAQKLYEKGIDLKEIRVARDNEAQIASSARELSSLYDYLFVTGGIGPTHDDITSQSIAKACNLPLEINKSALKIMEEFYKKQGEVMNEGRIRMARMPEGADLILNEITAAPGFKIRNIYVMAGIPKIMRSSMINVLSDIPQGVRKYEYSIKISIAESIFASAFENLQIKYPTVQMGSYPKQNSNKEFSTELLLRSTNKSQLDKASQELESIVKKFVK